MITRPLAKLPIAFGNLATAVHWPGQQFGRCSAMHLTVPANTVRLFDSLYRKFYGREVSAACGRCT